MPEFPYDNETSVVSEQFAVVYAPKRSRKRFPENCVTLYESSQEAIQKSHNDNKLFAAKVLGPSRSSEGLMLYYLVDWLTEDKPN